jgi:hypothetical protein
LALDLAGQIHSVLLVFCFAMVLLWEEPDVALLISFSGYFNKAWGFRELCPRDLLPTSSPGGHGGDGILRTPLEVFNSGIPPFL